MGRVTETELRAYMGLDSSVSVTLFLDDAHILMDTYMGVTPAVGEDIAKILEKNLAAHLYTVSIDNGGVTARKIGESSETYAKAGSSTGMGSTRYGQIVLSLDTTGVFNTTVNNDKKKAQFRVV